MVQKVRFEGISFIRYALIKPFLKIKGLNYSPFAQQALKWGCPKEKHNNLILIEDGFIRSKGLGVHLSPPCSLIFDKKGIYFDARGESDLEVLLNSATLSEDLLIRSRRLIKKLVDSDITKYNVGNYHNEIKLPKNRKIILVPGQVEGDASIRYGSPVLKSNLSLIQEVRKNNPDSYIVYKPHPDVVAQQRCGGDFDAIESIADCIVLKQGITLLFPLVDEVHTLTSLAGFEALLRNKKVVTYGLPFYAGWGVTEDKLKCDRRTSNRNIEELVACSLILYPTYWHPKKKCECEVEDIIQYLETMRDKPLRLTCTQTVLLKLKQIRNELR